MILIFRMHHERGIARWFAERHKHLRRHKKRHFHVVLFVNGVGTVLDPGQRSEQMIIELTLGHNVICTLAYLDANGNPMLTTPVPDSPATWTNTTVATETLVVAADGNSAVATTVAVGTDTINASVTVKGTVFAATLAVTVDAAPQVLTSVAINAVASV